MMKGWNRRVAAAVAVLMSLACASWAHAACLPQASGSSVSVSPSPINTGTYTSPTAPSAVTLSLTVVMAYTTTGGGGTCSIYISFRRSTLPATMAQLAGGSATLPYEITTAAGSGNSLLYSTAPPPTTARDGGSVTVGAGTGVRTITFTGADFARMLPALAQAGGNYSDSITVDLYNASGNVLLVSQPLTVTATVTKTCTISGVAAPTPDNVTIPITATGAVNTANIDRNYTTACNYPANVQLSSSNGGVRNAAAAPSGFARIINYNSTATFSGASATLNTATVAGATGTETGTASATSGSGTPSGSMLVRITPQANTQPLIAGSYSDTLRVTITPQ